LTELLVATQAQTQFNDYVIRDIGLADFGRKETEIAVFDRGSRGERAQLVC
jgi:hypothetical protein